VRMRRSVAAAAVAVLGLIAAGCSDDPDVTAEAADATVTPTAPTTAPGPVATTADAPPTTPALPVPPRALVVGDSTLLAVEAYERLDVFRGFDLVYDAKSCRTIGVPSCAVPPPAPPNVVETIDETDGPFDVVVVMAGYDEWWTSFPGSFDDAIEAARAKGASRILWLTYVESPVYRGLSESPLTEALTENNETLRAKVASGDYADVTLADWDAYVVGQPDWLEPDGIHLTFAGAVGVADYISRLIAFHSGLPCPAPTAVGGPVADPCPDPATMPPIDDVVALYR
jgi:hypothetical protein